MLKPKLHCIWLTDQYITFFFQCCYFLNNPAKAELDWEEWDTRPADRFYTENKKDMLFILRVVCDVFNDPYV